MNKKILRALSLWLVSLLAISGFSYYIYLNLDKYLDLVQISATGVFAIFSIALTFPLLNGAQNTILYRALGAAIPFKDGVLITAAATLANQLPVSGGIVSKGIYLKRQHDFSYTLFASSVVASFLFYITISGFIGLMILLYWLVSGTRESIPTSLLISYLLMASSFFLLFLPFEKLWLPENIRNRIQQAIKGWETLRKTPVLLAQLAGLQVLLMILLAGKYWLAFHMLSQNVTMDQTLLFSTASILTQLVSIAPGGLGVREMIVGAVSGILGFDASAGILAVGLDRLISTATVFLVGWTSIAILGNRMVVDLTDVDESDTV